MGCHCSGRCVRVATLSVIIALTASVQVSVCVCMYVCLCGTPYFVWNYVCPNELVNYYVGSVR